MTFRLKVASVAAVSVLAMAGIVTVALADNSGRFDTKLTGYEEIPTLSTSGTGSFSARLSHDGDEIAYELSYQGQFNASPAGGTVTQAHIHLGAPRVQRWCLGVSVLQPRQRPRGDTCVSALAGHRERCDHRRAGCGSGDPGHLGR